MRLHDLPEPMLTELLAPMSVDEFFEEHWERRHVHVRSEDRSRFRPLLSRSDVMRVLTTLAPSFPDHLQMAHSTRKVRPVEYSYPSGRPNVAHVLRLFEEGATIILPLLHFYVPSLNAFCRKVERELSGRVQTNIYLTPPSSQGFLTHYDNHDVFCLQVYGTKRWRLYESNRGLVFRGEEFNIEVDHPGPQIDEVVTEPGDLLYLPRGLMHDADTADQESLHITAGLFTTTWAELLIEAVSQVALDHEELRRSIPRGFGRHRVDPGALTPKLRELARVVAERADASAPAEHFAEDILMRRDPIALDQPEVTARAADLDADTPVGVRDDLLFRIRRDGDDVTLLCFGHEHSFPATAGPVLETALTSARVTARELPDEIDLESRLRILRLLLHEGCMRFVEPVRAAGTSPAGSD